MADRVPLPSRESFTDADVKSLYQNGYFDEEKIVIAYMGGRLADQEDIDRHAAYDIAEAHWTKLHGEPPDQKMRAYLWNFLEVAFDAAFGEV